MAEPKDFNQAKADFVTALLESVNGLSRVRAEQQLSSLMADLWNGLEVKIRQQPEKVREEQRL